uniref:Cytosine-specific methyltransferase n=1 Tax=Chenopodium quinoa TaxID=63459 RepID=A0A803KLX9_CHEQI
MPKRKSIRKKPSSSSSSASGCSKSKKQKVVEVVEKVEEVVNDVKTESSEVSIPVDEEVEAGVEEIVESPTNSGRKNSRKLVKKEELDCRFLGDPVPADEAKLRWPHRYSAKVEQGAKKSKTSDDDDEELIPAKCHYFKAEVDGFKIFELNDNAHVQSEDGKPPYICKILEMFEGVDGLPYFRAQWYYRSVDTVMKESITLREAKRVFASEIMDDNPLDCLLEKINIVRVTPNLDVDSKLSAIPDCDYYYDMKYLLPYSTYIIPPAETASPGSESQSTISSDKEVNGAVGDAKSDSDEAPQGNESSNSEITVLDLYCGCGAMSTGLCLGANLHGSNLVTRWAVDVNQFACQSLALNHPETNVRWKGYGEKDDTWEPLEGLSNCREKIGEFVKKGYKEKILPFPGDVDVVCGGPPCQGISGFNRFRNAENPLADPKNEQLVVYMDVVNYLKPKYALMENVVDLVKFSKGFLGRYALGRLVDMNYQARMGMMAAGAYGLPQFRMRVFIWGAQPSEKLPQYPLPTHDLVLRGVIPTEFEINTVAYNEGHTVQLENKLFLGDAISDMPEVTNAESRDEIPYSCPPKTEFQRFIRMTKDAMLGSRNGSEFISKLYDHRPLNLNVDDYQRVCRIPKKKGANFRDLPGVRVRSDNKVEWDPDVEREYLPSKKPLVPDYAMTFVGGTSSKPFARLWWDETVPTVVTRAEPHNQAVLHPVQDRVLTIRENARLQGFPDYYQLKGGVKDRYIQVGNAVAVPVARALGYSLALAMASEGSLDGPVMTLPPKFTNIHDRAASPIVEDNS